MCHPRYRDYLQQKLHGFRLIHEELEKSSPHDSKTKEIELTIKMLQKEIEILNKHLEEGHSHSESK